MLSRSAHPLYFTFAALRVSNLNRVGDKTSSRSASQITRDFLDFRLI